MINTRHFTYPTPIDGNLRPTSDPLEMLREGLNDQNRFFFTKGLNRILITEGATHLIILAVLVAITVAVQPYMKTK